MTHILTADALSKMSIADIERHAENLRAEATRELGLAIRAWFSNKWTALTHRVDGHAA